MANLQVVIAQIERCTQELVKIDSFRLTRMPKLAAAARTIERLQQEMVDAVYISPERRDDLAREVRVLASLLQGLPGPVIEKLLNRHILPWMPERKF
jgi:hypothetical protein